MPRRRSSRIRSEKVQLAIFRSLSGLTPPHPRAIEDLYHISQSITDSWKARFGKLRDAWENTVKPILQANNVPTLDYAKYRSFMNVVMTQVKEYGALDINEVIEKWATKYGANEDVLVDIARAIGVPPRRRGRKVIPSKTPQG